MMKTSETPIDRVLAPLGFPEQKNGYWHTRCPAHADANPSLYIREVEDGNVIVRCLAGCTTEEICASLGIPVAALFKDFHVRPPAPGISVIDLAINKAIHPNWLAFLCDVTDIHYKGRSAVRIPYRHPDGTEFSRARIRTSLVAKEGSVWSEGDEQLIPYGLHKLAEAREAGYLIWCEGESDSWTCWYHGLPALGIPGAGNTSMIARTLSAEMLAGIQRHYVVQEPGKAGKLFPLNVRNALQKIGSQSKVHILDLCRDAEGAKDPNDLHKRNPKTFKAAMQAAMEAADSRVRAHPKPIIGRVRDLQQKSLPETRWAIDPILPEGLTILAGKPKLGKSWLALGMLAAISSGGVALGQYAVEQGEVLYLALEDGERRLQKRSNKLLRDALASEDFYYATQWPRLDEGGLEALEEWMAEHPRVLLMCIDTWARFKPRAQGRNLPLYDQDYNAMAPLQALAQKHGVAIIVVDHTNKREVADDLHALLDLVTSSTGKVGGADGVLLLYRKLGEEGARMGVVGRDIEEEQELQLAFSPECASWMVKGDAEESPSASSPQQQELLDELSNHPQGLPVKALAQSLGKNVNTTRNLLLKLRTAKKVTLANNVYSVVTHSNRSNHSKGSNLEEEPPTVSPSVVTPVHEPASWPQAIEEEQLTTLPTVTMVTTPYYAHGHHDKKHRAEMPAWYSEGTLEYKKCVERNGVAEVNRRRAIWLAQQAEEAGGT